MKIQLKLLITLQKPISSSTSVLNWKLKPWCSSQGRGHSSCVQWWLLFSLYKDSKWHETLATLKSVNISAFFLSGQNFPWVLEELPDYLHAPLTPNHHALVTLNQIALLAFWESSPTHKPSLNSTDRLVTLLREEIYPPLQHTRVFNFFISVFLPVFAPVLALMQFSGWVSQAEPAEQFCVTRLVPQMNHPADH